VREAIETTRLELRHFQPSDAPELHDIFSDPMTHTIGAHPFSSLAETQTWIERRMRTFEERGLAWYALRMRDSGVLVGNCGVFIGRTGSLEPELGYEIRVGSRGQGLASEAAQAVLDECFTGGIPRVWATIRPHNGASLRIAARLGFVTQFSRTDERGELLCLSRAPRSTATD
jgi:RimJ/RimL family protein N-acetyltransferase